jgi:hypothetical protein
MEEFIFWLMLFFKALKYLLPFVLGGFFAIFAYYILGKPPLLIFFPIALIVILFIASEVSILYRMLHK